MDNVDNFVDKLGLDQYLGVLSPGKRSISARYRGRRGKRSCGQHGYNVGICQRESKKVENLLWIMWITKAAIPASMPFCRVKTNVWIKE